MSLGSLKQEIDRFISSPEPEVLCLKGGWGVGKTYLWDKRLEKAKNEGSVGYPAYSYVSLFGLNSLSDLRLAVFENRKSLTAPKPTEEKHKLIKLVSDMSGKLELRSRASLLKAIPFVGNLSEEDVVGLLSLAQSSEQIVCLDDIERRGNDLEVKDILGYASFLKEQRASKVVVILNNEQLDPDGQAQLAEHLEKVVDISLTMRPTPKEATTVALENDDKLSQEIAKKCRTLGVCNIRAIRRAAKLSRMLTAHLAGYEDKTQNNIISSLILFSWARDQPNEAPSIEFLRSLATEWHLYLDDTEGEDQQTEAAKWKPLLEEYGYGGTDELDLALIDSVEAGYFDMNVLRPLIERYNSAVKAEQDDKSFTEAWDLFHNSYSDNEDEVCRALYESFMENLQHITPLNALGTFRLLKELGREDSARKLVDWYIEGRDEGREFFDLDQNPFIEGPIDPYFREAFDRRRDELSQELDFKTALMSIGESWNSDTLSFLAAKHEDDYYHLFKSCEGEDLRKLLSSATSFRRIVNLSEHMADITKKVMAALTKIGKESRLNARRVRRFGIVVEAE